jgi:hypothetical protein
MPYCEEHNEVYGGRECPVCAGDDPGGDQDGGGAAGGSETDSIGDVVDEALGDARSAVEDAETSGDVVVGDQRKSVDRSTTVVDDSTEVHDRSTTVEDSVVDDSTIGGASGEGDGRTAVDDSVINDSTVGGEGETEVEDSVLNDATVGGEHVESAVGDAGTSTPDPETPPQQPGSDESGDGETAFCLYCGSEMPATAGFCPSCGEEQ